MEWALKNADLIAELALTHIIISVIPLLIGSLIALILAVAIPDKAAETFSGFLNAIFAIPSLALFVALPTLIGTSFLGSSNVLIALTIYVLASMFVSTRNAFKQVPSAALLTSQAQGLSSLQILIHVRLPLALPGFISGFRVASASTISMASIGAVVGVKNLGFLFLDGFQRKIPEEIITGIVAIFIIAIVFDGCLWFLGKVLTPWQREMSRRA